MKSRHTGRLLFGTFLALYLATAGGRLYVSDAHIKLMTARSLVDRGALDIPVESRLTARSPADGKSYSKFGILHSLLFVPATAAGKALVAAGVVPPESRALADGSVASAFSPLFTALVVLLFFLWGRALFGDDRAALRAAILLGGATMLWPYAKRSWSETPQAALLVGAALCLARVPASREKAAAVGAGLLVGASVALRVTGAVLVPLFALPLLLGVDRRTGARRLLLYGAGLGAVIIPLVLGVNLIRFGSPFSLFGWRTGGFTTPFFTGLAGLLVSPGESLFFYSPLLLAGVAFLPGLRRRAFGAFLLASTVPATLVLLYAAWWFHAYTWGPRFLLPAIPFLFLPLADPAAWAGRRRRRVIVVLAGAGVAIQILGVAVHLGDLDDLETPLVRHGYLPPDRRLEREDTWWHPLRTRPVSHLLALGDAAAEVAHGRPSGLSPDFWPWTLRDLFGTPLRATVPVQILLFCLAAAGLVTLGRRGRSPGQEPRRRE